MKAFYPISTDKIIHKGRLGNIYKLDGIQKCISLSEELRKAPCFKVVNVSAKDATKIIEASNLVNSVHNANILKAYQSGIPVDLANSSGIMWQPDLCNFVLESALVSKFATEEALKNGKSLAVVGGGHHAERMTPYGFCTINTMAIAAEYATKLDKRVTIVDLDAHYSNGCFDIFQLNKKVNIFSLWSQKLDKWKYFESEGNIWHRKVNDVTDYFNKLNILIGKVDDLKPDLLIYHLGLDVLETDRMGGVKGMDEENITRRERVIRSLVETPKIPFVIFLGGAYIDWSKGESYANEQRKYLTILQHKLINIIGLEKMVGELGS